MEFHNINPEDLPPHIREQIMQQIQHQQQHNAEDYSVRHEVVGLFKEFTEDQLMTISKLLKVFESDATVIPFFAGVAAHRLDSEFGRCMSCGEKHDEQIKDLTKDVNL